MILAKLIRGEIETVRFATATPATPATHGDEKGRTVATVATVAVATSTKSNLAPSDSRPRRYSYRFKLHNDEGGGIVVTDEPSLDRARDCLLRRYGDRLTLVATA
jgi:hypothetical protein